MDTNHKDVTSCLELDTSSKPTLHLTLYTIHHNNNREALTSRLLFILTLNIQLLGFHFFFHQEHHTNTSKQGVEDQTLV
jgi:RsiW-degrading membrane proteinase PrsW (M82 family)